MDAGQADALVGNDAGASDAGDTDAGERMDCSPPLPENTICYLGTIGPRPTLFVPVLTAEGLASASNDTARLELYIGHARRTGDNSVEVGAFDCEPGSPAFVELRLSGTGPGAGYRTDVMGGSCRFTITRGGRFASDPIEGSVRARVVFEGGDSSFDLEATFHYGAR